MSPVSIELEDFGAASRRADIHASAIGVPSSPSSILDVSKTNATSCLRARGGVRAARAADLLALQQDESLPF